ncbi:MAG: hypothetical protein QNI84_13155 [Henriciella sp.]|nr:hypothetical protein [Henriciella sp.]
MDTYTREVAAPISFVRGLGRGNHNQNVVVHVKGSHLVTERKKSRPIEPSKFLSALHDDGWLIVNIEREDKVAQVVSECAAIVRGAYHKTDNEVERIAVAIEPSEFRRRLKRRQSFSQDDRAALNSIPHIKLKYESDLSDPESHQSTVDSILSELRLPFVRVATDLQKIGSSDPLKMVKNRQQIEDIIATMDIPVACD